jgi:hypothetical protein
MIIKQKKTITHFQHHGNSITTIGPEVSTSEQTAAGHGLTCKPSHLRQW